MQVTDRGTGRVAGEPTLEDERQWPRREAQVVLGGPGGHGRGRRGKEEDRCFLGDMPTATLRPRSPRVALVAWLRHAGGTVRGDRDSEELMSWR